MIPSQHRGKSSQCEWVNLDLIKIGERTHAQTHPQWAGHLLHQNKRFSQTVNSIENIALLCEGEASKIM